MTYSRILEIDGQHSLVFDCGDLPADPAIFAAEHEPNGYFWEGVAAFVAPDLVLRLDLDSEAGMFSAVGSEADCESLQAVLEPLIASSAAITELIARADALASNSMTSAPA